MPKSQKIRLFVDTPLAEGQVVVLSQGQAHYLGKVMRRSPGDLVTLFNGKDGEWAAEIIENAKRHCGVVCRVLLRPQVMSCDLWLLFAPLKKARTDFVIEKAVELGVTRIMPVHSQYTNAERLRPDRLRSIAIEAAEQCRGLQVPEIDDMRRLTTVLNNWPEDRALVFADKSREGAECSKMPPLPAAILVGPEGGFSDDEREQILAKEQVCPISLGPRILRAETAVVAALSLFQSQSGDWV